MLYTPLVAWITIHGMTQWKGCNFYWTLKGNVAAQAIITAL